MIVGTGSIFSPYSLPLRWADCTEWYSCAQQVLPNLAHADRRALTKQKRNIKIVGAPGILGSWITAFTQTFIVQKLIFSAYSNVRHSTWDEEDPYRSWLSFRPKMRYGRFQFGTNFTSVSHHQSISKNLTRLHNKKYPSKVEYMRWALRPMFFFFSAHTKSYQRVAVSSSWALWWHASWR